MPTTTTEPTTTLTNLKIWEGDRFADGDTLRIRDGLIDKIGDRADFDETHSIDCAGATAVPGLIDAHVHLELNPDEKDPPEKTQSYVIPLMQERAAKMAAAGITTARDLGGGAWFELALRDAIAAGEFVGPRLLCSGQPITSVKGHCHFWGGEAESEDAACEVLQRQVDHGVDLIKIMATGGRMTRGSEPTDAQFPQSTMDRLVSIAHDHGLPVAAHCHGTEGIKRAAKAGVNTIEHCSWVGKDGWASDFQEDIATLIVENGAWVSPTVNKGWQRMLDSKSGNVLGRVRAAYRQMIDMGIPLVASTDAGIPGVFHADLPHALVVFAKIAQLSNAEAMQSATSGAARALGIASKTGRLEQGLAADLLVVDGDPLTDLTAITQPVKIFCKGREVQPAG